MPTPVDRHRVRELIAAGALVVEVLPPAEYEDEHLPGAINIPLRAIDAERVDALDPARAIVVYCYDSQ